MDTQPAFGFKEFPTFLIGNMAKAISERDGESKQRQFTRFQAVVNMILGCSSRDAIEAILAGRSVMFHEAMTDRVRDILRGEVATMRRGARSNLVALNKSFTGSLGLLERYRMRPSEGLRDTGEGRPAEPAAATRAVEQAHTAAARSLSSRRNDGPAEAETPAVRARTEPADAAPVPEIPTVQGPSVRALATFRTSSEAAALEAGDPPRFARAMKQAKGAAKQAIGKAVGDAKLAAEGKADKAEGKVQNAIGGMTDAIRDALKE